MLARGDDAQTIISKHAAAIVNIQDSATLKNTTKDALHSLANYYINDKDKHIDKEVANQVISEFTTAIDNDTTPGANKEETPISPADQTKIDDAQAKLDAAKEKEQSTANRMLGGLTTLATGIGGMQLAQGIAEKRADSAADKDMDAYIATMRCTYSSDNRSVPFSVEPVELPGGNNADLMKYRAEYIALAADLKERKTALNLKPGIEAEEILDKATMGLYDDENVGITGGTYASRYRATTQNNEKDEKGLASDKKEAKTRMIAGGVVAGVGVVGGIVGNSIINGNLGELIKKNKDKKASDEDNKKAISKLKSKARDAGLKDPNYIDKMNLESYNIGNYTEVIDKAKLKPEVKGDTIEHLCPTPQIECADKLLTEKSKQDLMSDVVGGKIGE